MKPTYGEKLDDLLVRYIASFNYRNYVNEMNLKDNDKVFEIGSGGGNLSRILALKIPNGKLTCVDHSEYWMDKSKLRLSEFDNVDFFEGDIRDFHEDKYFDVAVIHYVLHDIPKSEREETLSHVRDLLKNKGRLYIKEPTRKSHGMSSLEIKSLMNKIGMKEVDSKDSFSLLLRQIYTGVYEKK